LFSSFINFLTLVAILLCKEHDSQSRLILTGIFLINGLNTPGRALTGYTYFQEFFAKNQQGMIGALFNCIEGSVYICLTLYWSQLNYSWRWTVIFAAVLNLVCLLVSLLILPESPSWLFEKKRYTECHQSLAYIFEGQDLTEEQKNQLESLKVYKDKGNEASTEKKEREASVWQQLTSDEVIFRNMCAMTIVWLSASFCYYLISYQLKYLKGDIYINGMVSSASEILATFMSAIGLHYLGLRNVLVVSYIIAFSGMLLLTFSTTNSQLLLSIFILGSKFGVSQVFNLAYVGNIQLFPVALVATSYGVCNVVARCASIFAPLIAEMKPDSIAKVIFLSVILLALLSSTFIKEKKAERSPRDQSK